MESGSHHGGRIRRSSPWQAKCACLQETLGTLFTIIIIKGGVFSLARLPNPVPMGSSSELEVGAQWSLDAGMIKKDGNKKMK